MVRCGLMQWRLQSGVLTQSSLFILQQLVNNYNFFYLLKNATSYLFYPFMLPFNVVEHQQSMFLLSFML